MLRESFRRSVEIPEIIVKTSRARVSYLFIFFPLHVFRVPCPKYLYNMIWIWRKRVNKALSLHEKICILVLGKVMLP